MIEHLIAVFSPLAEATSVMHGELHSHRWTCVSNIQCVYIFLSGTMFTLPASAQGDETDAGVTD